MIRSWVFSVSFSPFFMLENIKVDILKRFKYAFNILNGFFIPRLSAFYQKPLSWFINRIIFYELFVSLILLVDEMPVIASERETRNDGIRRFNVTSFVHVNFPLSITPWIIIYCIKRKKWSGEEKTNLWNCTKYFERGGKKIYVKDCRQNEFW